MKASQADCLNGWQEDTMQVRKVKSNVKTFSHWTNLKKMSLLGSQVSGQQMRETDWKKWARSLPKATLQLLANHVHVVIYQYHCSK